MFLAFWRRRGLRGHGGGRRFRGHGVHGGGGTRPGGAQAPREDRLAQARTGEEAAHPHLGQQHQHREPHQPGRQRHAALGHGRIGEQARQRQPLHPAPRLGHPAQQLQPLRRAARLELRRIRKRHGRRPQHPRAQLHHGVPGASARQRVLRHQAVLVLPAHLHLHRCPAALSRQHHQRGERRGHRLPGRQIQRHPQQVPPALCPCHRRVLRPTPLLHGPAHHALQRRAQPSPLAQFAGERSIHLRHEGHRAPHAPGPHRQQGRGVLVQRAHRDVRLGLEVREVVPTHLWQPQRGQPPQQRQVWRRLQRGGHIHEGRARHGDRLLAEDARQAQRVFGEVDAASAQLGHLPQQVRVRVLRRAQADDRHRHVLPPQRGQRRPVVIRLLRVRRVREQQHVPRGLVAAEDLRLSLAQGLAHEDASPPAEATRHLVQGQPLPHRAQGEDFMWLGVHHVHRGIVLLVEQGECPHHALGGHLHLRAAIRHRHPHRAAAIHQHAEGHGGPALLLAQFQRHGQHRLQHRAPVASLAEAVPASRHHEPAARLLHVGRQRLKAGLAQGVGVHVLQHHRAHPIQVVQRQREGLAHLQPQARGLQRLGQRSRGLTAEEQHARRPFHAQHRAALVVLQDAVPGRLHLEAIAGQPLLLDQVSKGQHVGTRMELEGPFHQGLAVALQEHRARHRPGGHHHGGELKGLARGHHRGHVQRDDGQIQRHRRARHMAEVHGDAPGRQPPGRPPCVRTRGPPIRHHQHPAGALGRNEGLGRIQRRRELRGFRIHRPGEAPEGALRAQGLLHPGLASEGDDPQPVPRSPLALQQLHQLQRPRVRVQRHGAGAVHHHHHVAARVTQHQLGPGERPHGEHQQHPPEGHGHARPGAPLPEEEPQGDQQHQGLWQGEAHGLRALYLRSAPRNPLGSFKPCCALSAFLTAFV
ncbi:conserved hypothetical protein [Stigmatella aurantiaca DW4/3-1]|uniref:Uncharacterized protein n=1 Tax=Stigmatella aurantiaca (strain DW4/3-1) TaxID=378806 RepID=Q08X06_STIAD|nr:conserved hypothetical protein [Stigmatella aurantiaca DW4/3-1]